MLLSQVPSEVLCFIRELSESKPMRRGCLGQRYVVCGKTTCPCSDDPKQRHGPYFNLTYKKFGHSHYKLLNSEQAEIVRVQIDRAHKFRKCIDDYWDACERWADQELTDTQAADEATKKGASKKPLKKKSVARSKGF